LKNAEFAVKELSKLSDSSIYETLSLFKVVSAQLHHGIFHKSVVLDLELHSPHYKSGKVIETFQMVVLENLTDGTKSLAIDEFPRMDESAIETFSIKKMKHHQLENEKTFDRMESLVPVPHENKIKPDMTSYLSQFDSLDQLNKRRSTSEMDIQPRLKNPQLMEEQLVSKMSLAELYQMVMERSVTSPKFSNYFYYRANHILDAVLVEFTNRRNRH
jgi:hypothetical protein